MSTKALHTDLWFVGLNGLHVLLLPTVFNGLLLGLLLALRGDVPRGDVPRGDARGEGTSGGTVCTTSGGVGAISSVTLSSVNNRLCLPARGGPGVANSAARGLP